MKQVLAVEDDEIIAALLSVTLEEDGYSVVVAGTIAEGRARVAVAEFDLIILDRMLPDGDGFELARHLRATGVATPILLLTSRDSSDSVVEGLDSGADDYLTKPFEPSILKARLRALLRRGNGDPSAVVTFADLTIDRLRSRVAIGRKPVSLTRKEYELLEFLVFRPNQIVSRAELHAGVWGLHFDPGSNLIEVTVTRLRSKLAGSQVEFASIRGRGYMLTTRESAVTEL